jgi:hypothetical protein
MSSPVSSHEEFSDLASHKAMYTGYTHLITRGIIGVIVIVVFIGFVTGTL